MTPLRSRPQTAIAVLFLANVLNFYDRLALGAILEPLRREFHFTDTQLGALVTWFTIVFAVAGLPLGRLADTASRRRLLAAGLAVWAGLTAAAALATSYAMLLVTRLGVGIGEAVCAPVAASWIGDLVPAHRRARAMSAFMAAIPIGGMLSFAVTGPVAQAWGWRIALALAAAPVLILVPAVLWLSEPHRGADLQVRAGRPGGLPHRSFPPAFRWIAASGAIINFALYSFSTFLPAFLTRYHGASVARAGIWMGVGTGIAGLLAAAAVALLGDRVHNRLALASAASLLAAVPLFAALRATTFLPTVCLMMTGYALLQMYYGLIYAALQDLIAPPLRATAMAAYLVVTYLGGASWGPVVTGWLSDTLGSLHDAMYAIPAFSILLAVVLACGARFTRSFSSRPK